MFIRTSLFLTLTLLLSVPIFAQTPTKIGTAAISGRVTLKGEPAAGVSVGLQPQQSGPGGAPYVPDRSKYSRVKTDNEGRFSFSSLNAGQYRIVALAAGFVSADDSQLVTGKMVTLTDGENLESIELRLKSGAVITGRVTDSSGNPIVEKNVRLMKLDARGNFTPFNVGGEMTRTDDRGVYRIYSLPTGKYKVSMGYSPLDGGVPEMSRLYFAKTFHPDTTDEKQAKIVDLSEGAEATGVDIKIAESKKTYDISGRVIEAATGQPVAGIRLGYGTVMPNGGIMNSFGGMASTDAQGEYQIQGVLPGKYAVFADSRFDSQTTDFYSDQTQVEVTDGDLTGIEVKAHRGGSVSGIAIVEGTNDPAILKQLSSTNLNLIYGSSQSNTSSRSARPAANGSFRFSGVKPGKADIKAYAPGEGLKQIRVERDGVPITDGLDIQQGENITNLRVVFGYGTGLVRGQIKFIGGSAPAGLNLGLRVKILGGSGSEFYLPVDTRNQFILRNMPPGEYELMLTAYIQMRTPELGKLIEFLGKRTHRITIGNSEMTTEFTVDLSQMENDK